MTDDLTESYCTRHVVECSCWMGEMTWTDVVERPVLRRLEPWLLFAPVPIPSFPLEILLLRKFPLLGLIWLTMRPGSTRRLFRRQVVLHGLLRACVVRSLVRRVRRLVRRGSWWVVDGGVSGTLCCPRFLLLCR